MSLCSTVVLFVSFMWSDEGCYNDVILPSSFKWWNTLRTSHLFCLDGGMLPAPSIYTTHYTMIYFTATYYLYILYLFLKLPFNCDFVLWLHDYCQWCNGSHTWVNNSILDYTNLKMAMWVAKACWWIPCIYTTSKYYCAFLGIIIVFTWGSLWSCIGSFLLNC